MKTIHGDLIQLALEGEFDLIVHGCNCFCTMGAGIAKTIKQEFPKAYQADLETPKGDASKLGTISWATSATDKGALTVVNGYTQFNWKGRGRKADYEAIRAVFRQIKTNFSGQRIGYPAIGGRLGRWRLDSHF